jgi:hypothetical protein
MKNFKVPYAYLGKTPEAGTADIQAKSPEEAVLFLAMLRPNATIGEPWVERTRYRVTLYGTALVKQVQDIEADTPEEAANLAADNDGSHVWHYDSIRSIEQAQVSDYFTRELLEVIEVKRE